MVIRRYVYLKLSQYKFEIYVKIRYTLILSQETGALLGAHQISNTQQPYCYHTNQFKHVRLEIFWEVLLCCAVLCLTIISKNREMRSVKWHRMWLQFLRIMYLHAFVQKLNIYHQQKRSNFRCRRGVFYWACWILPRNFIIQYVNLWTQHSNHCLLNQWPWKMISSDLRCLIYKTWITVFISWIHAMIKEMNTLIAFKTEKRMWMSDKGECYR